MADPQRALIQNHLALTVPLAYRYWTMREPEERQRRLAEAAELIARHGDDLLYGGEQCRIAMTALVDALALLSMTGEVRAFGLSIVHGHVRWIDELERA